MAFWFLSALLATVIAIDELLPLLAVRSNRCQMETLTMKVNRWHQILATCKHSYRIIVWTPCFNSLYVTSHNVLAFISNTFTWQTGFHQMKAGERHVHSETEWKGLFSLLSWHGLFSHMGVPFYLMVVVNQ